MNNKNIVGNGSKATLPDGKNLSDKIQESRLKQGINNNVNSLNHNNSEGLGSKKNESEDKKKKSNAENVAQQAGSEALKKSLKAAFPYIPQFIINKLVDSKKGQEVIEKTLNKTKRKIIFGLLGTVATILMHTFLICAIVAAILSPVAGIKDALGKVGDFFVSVWNIFKYGEYCSDEAACQEKLSNKYYEKLDSTVEDAFGDCEQIDTQQVKDLITGTIFYDQMTYDSNYKDYQSKGNDEDKEDDTLEETNNSGYFDYRGKKGDIKPLVDKLKSGDSNSCILNSYSYRNHLTNTYVEANYDYVLVGHYKDDVEGKLTIEEVVNEIMLIGGFEGKGSNGSCSNSCSYNINGESISEIQVRLINGVYSNSPGTPIEGEELVPFEKYILGVVYGEVGSGAPDEVMKAQAIAARSYALTRGKAMNGAMGLGLHNEDGKWILTLRNSTEDQVYCDPDKGCSKINGANSTVYSDPDKYQRYKGPLSADERIRSVVNEVSGKVVLDGSGNIVYTPYTNANQNSWTKKASEGKNYTVMLREDYPAFNTIDDGNCSALCNSAVGPYTEWKQYNWSDVYMNNLSIKEAGCLTVSVCMQVARSGVETPLGANFNPGTFVNEYRKYLYNGDDNWNWSGISSVIPKFKYDNSHRIAGMQYLSDEQQRSKLIEGINTGCYYVVEVRSYYGGQHWVAVDTVKDGEIYIMDPASNCKALSKCTRYRISQARCYRVVE